MANGEGAEKARIQATGIVGRVMRFPGLVAYTRGAGLGAGWAGWKMRDAGIENIFLSRVYFLWHYSWWGVVSRLSVGIENQVDASSLLPPKIDASETA